MNKEATELMLQLFKNTDETFDLLAEIIKRSEARLDYLEDKFIKVLECLEKENERD